MSRPFRLSWFLVASITVALLTFPIYAQAQSPQIASISPTSGPVGTQITITGTGFGATAGTASVNWTNAAIQSWSNTQVVATVGAGTTTGGVRVVNGGVTSNAVTFTLPNPQMASISPTSGPVGTQITITGTGFGATAGTASVNWTNATIQSWTDTQVGATVGAGTTTGGVRVVNGGVTSNAVTFTLPNPQIASISPTSGPVGTQITITGTGFGATAGTASVNWTNAAIQSWSDTQVVVTVGAGTTTGGVRVVNGGVTSNAVTFTLPNPQIASISPTSGPVGTQITITGTNFGTTGTVTFNGTTATPTSWTATSIVVPVPAGASTGNVVVTVSGLASNGVNFTFIPTPSITSLSPASGPVGTSVTITGTNFGTTGTVTFNGTTATPTSWTATSIVATVPTGATTGNVVVTVNGIASNGVNFTFIPTPSITNLSPTSGAVGASVTITGTNFGSTQGTSTVTFNGTTATTITSWSATSIVATVPTGATTGNVVVTVGGVASNGVTFSVLNANFTLTGNLATARMYHTATLLNNGSVLVAGGMNGYTGAALSSAELYSPVTGLFAAMGNLNTARLYHTTTLLNNGAVLVVGGQGNAGSPLSSAELYSPVTGLFAATGSLNTARRFNTATLLTNGQVLIVGGADSNWNEIGSAELYDPASGTFTFTGSLNTARAWHTATLLNNGKVLIAGGWNGNTGDVAGSELYDPTTGTFVLTGNLNTARDTYTATLLNNGKVLIVGGNDNNGNTLASAELYDPAAETFALTGSLNIGRTGHGATLLSSGLVLIVGGLDGNGNALASAELYDPATGTFTVTGSLNSTRQGFTTTLLDNGQVLIAGGMDANSNTLNSAELYQPSSLIPAGLVSIAVSPSNPSVIVGETQLFTAAGTFSDNSTQNLDSVTWTSSDSTVATITNDASNRGNAVTLMTGSATVSACTGSICGSTTMTVVWGIQSLSPTSGPVSTSVTIIGSGFGATQNTSTVTFNGTTATAITSWSPTSIVATVPVGATTGNVVVTVGGVASNGIGFTVQPGGIFATSGQMQASRYGQTATQLPTGQILIAGGMSTSGVANGAEIYTPLSQTFAAANAMNVARWLHTATLLNDGTVLVAGGSDLANEETLDSAEIYNPTTGTFTLLSNTLNTARVGHTATLLNNGQVLLVGGYDPDTGLIADAELYDPPTQTFIDLGDTNAPRYEHTATMLQNGQVLIAGGDIDPIPSAAYNTAEIFDPVNQTFRPVPVPMTAMREGQAAALLNNGQVLITGGDNPPTGSLNTAEIYDPPSNTFTTVAATMTVPRISHVMTLLNGGKVLINGGATDALGSSTALITVELYDPASQTFAAAGNMASAREHQTASLLNDGTVLVVGGTNGTNALNTADLYMSSQLNGLASIAITPTSQSIGVGAQQLFNAVGTFNDGSTQTLSSVLWSSSSATVAPISGDATNSGVAATAAQGTTTITARAAGVSSSATLTVTTPTLVSITLSPQAATIPLGATQQFTATGVYTDGSTQDLTATATWSSSATVVAAINGSGLTAGLFQGTATIQVNSGSLSASTTLSVAAPALVSIAVTPATATIALGTSQQYQAIGTYSDGSTQNIATTLLTWSSGTPAVATITNAGLATSLTQGATTLTGGFESVSASVTLTVGPPNLISITVVPDAASLSIGATQQLSVTGIYTDGSTQNLTASSTWASSNPNVIGVSSAGLATAVATGNTTITATSGSMNGTAALVVTTGTTQANLNTSRYQHSSTILNNGQILVAGGVNCPTPGSCTYLNSAELYNPATNTFTTTGPMATARSAPAVLLNSGKVFIAGGYTCDGSGNCSSLDSAEIYDPIAGTFSSAGTMGMARSGHTMTVLNDGTVLIAGGQYCDPQFTSCYALSGTEIYDPNAGTFIYYGYGYSMSAARFGASAVLLNSGSVLIAGGFDGTNLPAAAEIYSPSNGFAGPGPSLNVPRFNATATLLNNGQVLVTGGSTCALPGCPTNAAEIYDPVANTFTLVPSGMNVPRFNHSATLTTNGQVVITGGFSSCGSTCTSEASTEFFDPVAGTFTSGQPVATALAGHTGTLLANGNVLLIGGINAGVTLAGDEWYQPTSFTPANLVSIAVTPASLFLQPGQTQQFVAKGTFNDGSTQTLQSVIWNSSNPSAALISNSPGSAGFVNAQATGVTTLTATAGDLGGSASLNVEALVSLAITPANPSIAVGSSQQLTATGTFSDGSQQYLTTSVTWSSSNSSIVMIGATPGLQGYTLGVASGTATITAAFGSTQATTLVTVQAAAVPNPPSIITVSPSSGQAGTQVTISGSGFGAQQGSGTVWLGSTYGVVVSWSDSQIVANVAAISQSGTAQVQQNGLSSNSMPFTVNTATILTVSPSSGVPGTPVTITGSGFGATQGTGQVWLGTANGVVLSWSDSQVVAEVALGSMTGKARILQNGVMSNAVPFTINLPHITSITPNYGAAGTVVTINGSGFGGGTNCGGGGGGGHPSVVTSRLLVPAVTQDSTPNTIPNNSYVWIGGADGSITTWCSTKIVASVPSSAVTGVVQVEEDGLWSNALPFTVSSSGPSATLVPNAVSLVIGETRTIDAVDANGNVVTGLAWSSSNTAIATLSTDDPPVITALTSGTATISAGNNSALVTVYPGSTLPLGTVIWSNPGDGSGVVSIVPAVPSPTGVADVFALNSDCNLQAMRSDGSVAWTANIGQPPPNSEPFNPTNCSEFVPDFQGGAVVMSAFVEQVDFQPFFVPLGYTLQKFDGTTGQPYPAYTLSALFSPSWDIAGTFWSSLGGNSIETYPPFVVHTDGTIFTVESPNNLSDLGVAVIDPLTGGSKPISFSSDPLTAPYTNMGGPSVGNWIIAGDGYAYLPYVFDAWTVLGPNNCPQIGKTYFRMLRADTSGNVSSIALGGWDWYYNCSSGTGSDIPTAQIITNADQGVLVSWEVDSYAAGARVPSKSYHVAVVNGGSLIAQGTTPNLVTPVLQAQDGTFYGTSYSNNGGGMVKFDQSGNIQWTVPNDSPQIATADGGVIGSSGITYDNQGRATGQVSLPIQSWPGYAYTDGPVDQVVSTIITEANIFWPFTNFWPVANANDSGNSTAKALPPPDANHNHTLTVREVGGQGKNVFRHITVQVDDYPEVGFGPVNDLTAKQIAENTPVPGNIEYRAAGVPTKDAVTIYLTEAEAVTAQMTINDRHNYPGYYQLRGRSCVDFGETVVSSTGFPVPTDVLPRSLPKDIRAEQIKENTVQAP